MVSALISSVLSGWGTEHDPGGPGCSGGPGAPPSAICRDPAHPAPISTPRGDGLMGLPAPRANPGWRSPVAGPTSSSPIHASSKPLLFLSLSPFFFFFHPEFRLFRLPLGDGCESHAGGRSPVFEASRPLRLFDQRLGSGSGGSESGSEAPRGAPFTPPPQRATAPPPPPPHAECN